MVDLNNFASFPTLAIGLLVAALRAEGHEVRLVSPLAHDVPSVLRERRETYLDHLKRRLHLSASPAFLWLRDGARRMHDWMNERPDATTLAEIRHEIERGTDVILLSAYLQHYRLVREICRLARARGIRVILGGPMFNVAEIAEIWRTIPGLTVLVGAEMDRGIGRLVEAAVAGEDLARFPGTVLPDGRRGPAASPLRDLDLTPMADYTDFPWDRYPVRIIPLMAGRGCQWDKCLFCSDVISVSGRTFRTRSVESVLVEMQEQARRHGTTNFVFLDLKLNSYPDMIRGIAAEAQRFVRGAEWIGTVHVDLRRDNGLSAKDLALAVEGGMRRISFGLESGSQRMLDLMNKGSSVEANAAFIRNAHAAGLSVRCTMFNGFPGETAEDMSATADFLEAHKDKLDRVRFNAFSLQTGTPIHRAVEARGIPDRALHPLKLVNERGRIDYTAPALGCRAYRRAKARALRTVYEINSRPLRIGARQFDGLM